MNILNKEELNRFMDGLKEIPRNQIIVVYENDNLDGPIEGVCKWQDEEYYFVWCGGMDEEKDEMIRKFFLIKLTDNQITEEKREHLRFVELSRCGKLEDFYEEKKSYPGVEINGGQLIGWFGD
jgi:hypothetical protein